MKTAALSLLLALLAPLDLEAADFEVEVDPSVYPAAQFEAKGVKAGNIPSRAKRPDALPDRKDREAAFARVPGLGEDVASMDELDRDLLFVRAKNTPLTRLRELYPKIDAKKLTRLRKEAGR